MFRRSTTLSDKVAPVTSVFWLAKIVTTGMGEVLSDFLVTHIQPVLAVAAAFIALVAIMVVQFRARRYIPWVYWTAVALVSVFGTMAADVAHVVVGIPYAVSTLVLAVALAAVFALWFASERTLSIHTIRTRRREAFYWAAVLVAFALGTAAGDWTATVLGLGYLNSGLLFLGLMIVPLAARALFRASAVAAFWAAYVLTRPIGASFADWLGVGPDRGGVGVGTGTLSALLIAALVLCIAYLGWQERRRRAELSPAAAPGTAS